MKQPGLFDDEDHEARKAIRTLHDRPYSEPTTSREAAESMRSSAASLRAKVLAFIQEREQRGATCDEIQVALDMRPQTASARCWELHKGGIVIKTNLKRKTRTGRNARAYVAASFYDPEMHA